VRSFKLSVKAVVLDAQGRALVLRRSASSRNHAGLWDFPGGKVDPGEAVDTALRREIEEETRLPVQLTRVVGHAQAELADAVIAYLFIEASAEHPDVALSTEHDAHQWVNPGRLPDVALAPQFTSFAQTYAKLARSRARAARKAPKTQVEP
jgi:8-oxo-dGTP diphosphatase